MAMKSPLTGRSVNVRNDPATDITYYEDICGLWGLTEAVADDELSSASITGGRLSFANGRLGERETRSTLSLARSLVWRLAARRARPVFMTKDGSQMAREAGFKQEVLNLEDISQEVRQLSLEDKALSTLENLADSESDVGIGTPIPYNLHHRPGGPGWGPMDEPRETGLAYGCTFSEANVAFRLLMQRNLISIAHSTPEPNNSHVFITPDGYAEISKLRRGLAGEAQQAFFVCRFIPEIDHLYDLVIRPLGDELRCPVRRIKDIHHNDKIDDRICHEIQRSSVVLVDLTDTNFNVGFEAGYAIALRKPIVWTQKSPDHNVNLPFDISTYNCLTWNPSDLGAYRESLKHRLMTALQWSKR